MKAPARDILALARRRYPRRTALIGVDVAETYLRAARFDLALDVQARIDRPAGSDQDVVDAIRELSGAEEVLAVGLSGPVPDRIGERVPVPVYREHPLRAATVAELCRGAGRRRRDLVVVHLGTRVGAGIAIGGAVFRGVTGNAGEWGHTTLVLDGRLCRCGRRGCVEAYVGAPGIVQHLRELAPASCLARCDDRAATIEALGAAADAADPVATKVISETARYLGTGLGDLVNLLNPEAIVLGGWVGRRLGAHLLPEVRAVLDRSALHRPLDAVHLRLSTIDTDAVSLGVAFFALQGILGR